MSAALTNRLHQLAKDVPGYTACEACTWTRREAACTCHFTRLSVTVNRQVRTTAPFACPTMEEAVETAFEEITRSLDAVRRKPKQLPAAPKQNLTPLRKTG
ncbi:hypothetical protein [Rufibacter soli]